MRPPKRPHRIYSQEWFGLEAPVQARADDIGAETQLGTCNPCAVTEIDVKIFDLGRERSRQRSFETAAERPAGLGFIGAADARDRRADIADGEDRR